MISAAEVRKQNNKYPCFHHIISLFIEKKLFSILGSLTFKQETGAVLSLIGSFDLIGEDISKHEIILGESSEGKKVTLLEKFPFFIFLFEKR
ncbi:MAG: hypothetical protein M3297_01940 [Thermoproteota archaeon]|jgi:hypothetical protein|nr:hypothetical protein [Thermoproteota archaeon]